MNYFSIIPLLLVVISSTTLASAQLDQIPRFFYQGTGTCTAADYEKIDSVMVMPGRRLLLRSNSTVSRELNTYPAFCNRVCKGFATGHCDSPMYPSCDGYRRLGAVRSLQTCDTIKNTINNNLDNLRSSLTSSCRSLIGDKYTRKSECVNRLEYGEIVAARLWKIAAFSRDDSVLSESLPSTGYKLCKSTVFNIESVNDPCVKKGQMKISGPNGYLEHRTELVKPYTIFGDNDGKLHGRLLNVTGEYTFTITPDDDIARAKSWKIMLTNC